MLTIRQDLGKFWYINELAHMRGRLDRIAESEIVIRDQGRAGWCDMFADFASRDFQKRHALITISSVRANRLALSEMGRAREIPSMSARLLGHAADCRRAAR